MLRKVVNVIYVASEPGLDKSGRIVYSLVMGIHNRVSDK